MQQHGMHTGERARKSAVRESALESLRSNIMGAYNEREDAMRQCAVALDTLRLAGWKYSDIRDFIADNVPQMADPADFELAMENIDNAEWRF